MTLWTMDVSGSIVTMPPLTRRGDKGVPVNLSLPFLWMPWQTAALVRG
jgi:hypothetical protein